MWLLEEFEICFDCNNQIMLSDDGSVSSIENSQPLIEWRQI
jgi:hypothetical protein